MLCVMGLFRACPTQTAEAEPGIPAGTTTYRFVAAESTVTQSDAQQVYAVEGRFELTVDLDTRAATFSQADIRANDDPNGIAPDLNAVFDLTAMVGFVLDDTTIEFKGEGATGRGIALTLTFEGDAVHLSGRETASRVRLCSGSYALEALAWRQYGGEGTIPEGKSAYVFLPDQSTLVQDVGFCGIHRVDYLEGQFELTVDLGTGTGFFQSLTATAIDAAPPICAADPNFVLDHVFDVTGYGGTVVNESTIYLKKGAVEDSHTDIVLTLTFDDATMHLAGHAFPSGGCYDCLYHTVDVIAQKKYGGGTGEPNYPYLIHTAEQLNAIGAEPNDWDRHFKLMADIDLAVYSDTGFNIIGVDANTPFTGVFDGNDHIISNFRCVSTGIDNIGSLWPDTENIGLFGIVDDPNAAIRNLALEDPNVYAPQSMAVGALVGYLRHGELTHCHVTGGQVSGFILSGCLVGRNNGTITSCFATGGSIMGNSTLGGLVGANSGTITACQASSDVDGGISLGGLVGSHGGDITACCATGGTVSGIWTLGGLVGHSDGTVTNCYATDSVSGSDIVGGLVGHSGGSIRNCYATGAVSGRENVGGLLGRRFQGQITGSFWDIETSGQAASAAGLGRTTVQMQVASMFRMVGWDFVGETKNGTDDVWWIPPGQDYPRLWWEQFAEDTTE
jgi:The GLUG motif